MTLRLDARLIFLFLLAIFLSTAGVGVWASYDRAAAWRQFAWLVGSAVLALGLVLIPARRRQAVVWTAGLLAVLLALVFLLAHDWQSDPAEISAVQGAALQWMQSRPELPFLPDPGVEATAAILAVLVFFPGVLLVQALAAKQLASSLGWSFELFVVFLALASAAEKGTWAALGIAAAIFALSILPIRRRAGWGWAVAGVLALAAGLLMVARPLDPAEFGSREQVWANSLKLVEDFPLGGGLASFPGLYSQYILSIPYESYDSSHQLWIEVAVEQGMLGLIALLGLAATALVAVLRFGANRLWRAAALAGVVALLVQGLADSVLYGGWGTLFLLATFGLAIGLGVEQVGPQASSARLRNSRRAAWIGAVGLAMLGLATLSAGRPILGDFYATRGALEMAQLELSDFPANAWREAPLDLSGPQASFEQAFLWDPGNRTALHRLGLIALQERDFVRAADMLGRAAQADETSLTYRLLGLRQHGLWKDWAFAELWSGNPERAAGLMQNVPEAQKELAAYQYWWRDRGRKDLSRAAGEMLQTLYADGE